MKRLIRKWNPDKASSTIDPKEDEFSIRFFSFYSFYYYIWWFYKQNFEKAFLKTLPVLFYKSNFCFQNLDSKWVLVVDFLSANHALQTHSVNYKILCIKIFSQVGDFPVNKTKQIPGDRSHSSYYRCSHKFS